MAQQSLASGRGHAHNETIVSPMRGECGNERQLSSHEGETDSIATQCSARLAQFHGAVERSPVVEGERLGHMNKCLLHAVRLLPVLLATPMTLAQPSACEQAWADYKAFKARTVMEESQYPLTVQGAAVRAACGADALPAPPGADTPPLPRVRKPRPPAPPPNPPRNL